MFLRNVLLLALLMMLTLSSGFGQMALPGANAGGFTAAGHAAANAPDAKEVARPKSFDKEAMDLSVNPCEDFYEYACGSWRRNNPIPADQSRWGRFNELAEYNRQLLRRILEQASVNDPKRTPVTQKIGDMYQSCMDDAGVNAKGATPVKPQLDRIAAISSRDQLIDTIAWLHSLDIPVVFRFSSTPDMHNASMQIAAISQGGLGLPDRDYYVKQDAKSQETRQKYLEHMANMFVLLGDEQQAAVKEAQAVMALETQLAQAAYERVKMRDPKSRDHKLKVSELAALAPNFEFARFFAAGSPVKFTEVNVAPPDFFQKVNGTFDSVSLDGWKSYLRWHVVRTAAMMLSDKFVNESFHFYGQYMNGQKELQPRWKRCVQTTDQLLGEALGQQYVKEAFGGSAKGRMLEMVDALEAALGEDIQNLDWMSAETKKQALVKLKAITNKIGYPEKWRDYSTVKIVRGDLAGDWMRARAFEVKRTLNKIGKPVDKKEWGMTPPTVNAYYSPPQNNINFPAGILQPPFFDNAADDAVNFGGIGVVIGHELTHGFDDQGSKFDAEGNLTNWWTQADRDEFDKRTSCIADEYGSFVAIDDLHLNGRLTLGENTADNGGARVAMMALRSELAKKTSVPDIAGGFTPEQRFFLGFAQVWCENRTPESARLLALTDPHSPGRFRVIGTVQNNPDFAKAFNCKAGQKMVSEKVCRVW